MKCAERACEKVAAAVEGAAGDAGGGRLNPLLDHLRQLVVQLERVDQSNVHLAADKKGRQASLSGAPNRK